MPKLKSGTILPTPEEDARITQVAEADPDARPFTDEEWRVAKPMARIGRPKSAITKIPTTIRFDPDVLAALKATGAGWQTRVNEAMREWVNTHKPV